MQQKKITDYAQSCAMKLLGIRKHCQRKSTRNNKWQISPEQFKNSSISFMNNANQFEDYFVLVKIGFKNYDFVSNGVVFYYLT